MPEVPPSDAKIRCHGLWKVFGPGAEHLPQAVATDLRIGRRYLWHGVGFLSDENNERYGA